MAYDLEEQETLEQFKAWWEKWGNVVTGLVTVVALAFAGYNGWQWYKRHQDQQALNLYAGLLNVVAAQHVDESTRVAQTLMGEYSGTVYAPMAALEVAQLAANTGNNAQAQSLLQWVLSQKDYPEYHVVAAVRLAGVDLNLNQAKEALAVLTALKTTDSDTLLVQDRLGDVYWALGDVDNARQAWQTALKAATQQPAMAQLIGIKLSQLPH